MTSTSPISTETTTGSKTRKKRTVVVVRRPQDTIGKGDVDVDTESISRKKKVLVSRRPRTSEEQLFRSNGNRPHHAGAGSGGGFPTNTEKLKWHPDGRVLESSVLGTAAAFEEMEAQLGWARDFSVNNEDTRREVGFERSLHRQRSKESTRSAGSGARTLTGDRSTNDQASAEGGSHPDTTSEDQMETQREMVEYFRRISDAEKTAAKNRAKTLQEEAKFMERVGLTERLSIEREGNALRQWERRRRDWHRVTEDIVTKTGKDPEDLVMSAANEYRERSEEYQLIQSAMPSHKKFGGDGYWMMSLRGFGDRVCTVGNIFSGLSYVIEDRILVPRAIRKPTAGHLVNASRKGAWRKSDAFVMRKKQLASALRSLRPQQLEPQHIGGLLVQGRDLLEWAATSSQEYFQLRHVQKQKAKLVGLNDSGKYQVADDLTGAGDQSYESGKTGCMSTLPGRTGPAMEVISPKVLLIETTAGGGLRQGTVAVRNTGSTALFFSWSRVLRDETIVSKNGDFGCGFHGPRTKTVQGEAGRGGSGSHEGEMLVTESARARHAALQDPVYRFFCYRTSGTLLPGETSTISFSFQSLDPGLFSDRWRLETTPSAPFSLLPPPPIPTTTPRGGGDGTGGQALGFTEAAAVFRLPSIDSRGGRLVRQDASDESDGDTLVESADRNKLKDASRKGNQEEENKREVNDGGKKKAAGLIFRSASENKGCSVGLGVLEVELRGVALSPDTRKHVRTKLSKGIETGVMAAKVEEIVREVVRGVHTPIREEEIRRRQREAFLSTNSERGLYFTPRLYDAFASLLQRAKAAAALATEAGSYDASAGPDEAGTGFRPAAELSFNGEGQCLLDGDIPASATRAAMTAMNTANQGENVCDRGVRKKSKSSSVCTHPGIANRSSFGKNNNYGESNGDNNNGGCSNGGAPLGLMHGHVGGGEMISGSEGTTTVQSDVKASCRGSRGDRTVRVAYDEATSSGSGTVTREMDEDRLRSMLQALDSAEWDGAVDTVLGAIEGLSKWIPECLPCSETERQVSRKKGGCLEMGARGDPGPLALRPDENGVAVESDEHDDDDGEDDREEDDEGGAEEEGEDESNQEQEEEEEEEDRDEHPLVREQRSLREEWRLLVLDAQLEPETDDCSVLLREEVVNMAEKIAGAMEDARKQAGDMVPRGGGTLRGPFLRYDKDSWKAWAAACPSGTFRSDVDGGAQAHAVAAAKARNPIGCFLALAYGKIASNIVDAVEKFEGRLATDMADRRKKAALGRRAIVQGFHDVMNGGDGQQDMTIDGLSRLAALAPREDVLGRRVLFHVDFSRAKERSPRDLTSDAAGGSGSGKNFRVEHRLYSSETVQLVAEQVRAMLAAKAATVAIISESAAPSAGTIVTRGHNSPSAPLSLRARVASVSLKRGIETSGSSLLAIATTVSSLLGMEVEFYETVPEMGEALAECGSAGDAGIGGSLIPFIPRLMMVERLSAPGVVPAPAVKDPEMSDAEEERLPDFAWGGEEAETAAKKAKEIEAERLETEGPREGDLSAMLNGVVDVVVLDAPRTMYEPRRGFPWGPRPTTDLTVAGIVLHADLTAMAYLTEASGRPLLAVVGGGRLEPRVKLVDGLVDLVDILAIGGGLAATFLAAASAESNADESASDDDRRRLRKRWLRGPAGPPRDALAVMKAARRLLTKARKRGVEVILPRDFVVGDVEVDEHGIPHHGQTLPDERRDQDDGNTRHVGSEEDVAGGVTTGGTRDEEPEVVQRPPTVGATGVVGDAGGSFVASDFEPDDGSLGFEYTGETMDVSLENGIPRGFFPMDIGPQTTIAFKEAVHRAGTVLWHGMIGVAECSAFQSGSREVLEALITAHDNEEAQEAGTSPVVILCGRSLGEWADRLAEREDDSPPLGAGSGVSHVCADPGLCTRVLEGRVIPGISQLTRRDPPDEEADLGKMLRRPFDDDDTEGDDDRSNEESSSD